ncbi:MAG: sulfatase-like hydrolase/transferase [Bacteroidales bacterium]|nr:sulfatase-like hydrolase/transferase [Bacteroidales bacterium]MCF8454486.1 sulfatase-like hydrolase/transferase [Bacteroidales bacterium]
MMREYIGRIKLLAKRVFLLLIAYQFARLFFFLVNYSYFSTSTTSDILSVFFYGIRFDYATIVYYNGVFLLLSILPFDFLDRRPWQTFLKSIYVFVNSLLLMADMGDAVYFRFSNKRTTADFFSATGPFEDFLILLPKYLSDFWFVPVTAIILVVLLIVFYPKNKKYRVHKIERPPTTLFQYAVIWFAFLITSSSIYFLARGFSLKPIRIITAAEYAEASNIPLVLTTGFSIITTLSSEDLPQFNFFNSVELEANYPIRKDFSHQGSFRKMNVVVIIMESFGKEYVGSFNHSRGYTPFLDSLLKKGTNCRNAFACGRKSIEALPAILSGIPALSPTPFITSQFASNEISGIPYLLRQEGYHTSFFHGGRKGTMGFDYFANLAGIEHYFSMEDYPNEEGFDGNWGIFDEEYFQYFSQKLTSFSQPFFSCIFSLSSHHPYRIPEKYRGRFLPGQLDIHESVQYADYALKRFFESASKEDWFANTLFVVTADHTSLTEMRKYQTSSGAYEVPLLLYHQTDSTMPAKIETYCSHIDIFPSVMDYLNYPYPFLSFGQSFLETSPTNAVTTYINSGYQYIAHGKYIFFDGENFTLVYDLVNDTLLQTNLIDKPEIISEVDKLKFKAILQSYTERMAQNKMVLK